jgi:hypothetical protein
MKMAYITDVEKALQFKQNHSATLIQRLMYLRENPFTSGTNHSLKLVALVPLSFRPYKCQLLSPMIDHVRETVVEVR